MEWSWPSRTSWSLPIFYPSICVRTGKVGLRLQLTRRPPAVRACDGGQGHTRCDLEERPQPEKALAILALHRGQQLKSGSQRQGTIGIQRSFFLELARECKPGTRPTNHAL